MNTEDPAELSRRLNLLEAVPLFLVLNAAAPIPGTIVDLRTCETDILLHTPSITHPDLRSEVSARFRTTAGIELIKNWRPASLLLHQRGQGLAQEAQILDSLNPEKLTNLGSRKLRDIDVQKYLGIPELAKKVGANSERVLGDQADHRIKGKEKIIAAHMGNMASTLHDNLATVTSAKEFLCKMGGLQEDALDDDMTLRAALAKLEFLKGNEIVAENLLIDLTVINRIDESTIPSWIISKAIRHYTQKKIASDKNRRAEGGNLNDAYLAAFSFYIDMIVDKRTYEGMVALRRKLSIFSSCRFHKLSNYKDAKTVLAQPS